MNNQVIDNFQDIKCLCGSNSYKFKFHVESMLPGKIQTVEIRFSTHLEYIGSGIKGFVKGNMIFMDSKFNKGDEIIATFRKISS